MQIRIVTATVLVFAVVTASPSNAIFGNECKKPKTSYEQQLARAKSLNKSAYQFTQQEKAAYFLEQRKSSERYLKSCLKDKKMTRAECKELTGLFISNPGTQLVHQDILDQANKTFNTAYRIVVNNQKCFDPVLVVEAQRALGK